MRSGWIAAGVLASRALLLTSWCALLLAVVPGRAAAQTVSVSTPRDVVTLEAQPGQAISVEIPFVFDGGSSAKGTVGISDFKMTERGPEAAPPGGREASAASRWIKLERSEFPMQPGVPTAIRFQVIPPADAEPGDHVVGLTLRAVVETEGQGKVSRWSSVRVVLTVPGAVQRQASLKQFGAVREPLSIGWRMNDNWVGLSMPNPIGLFEGGTIEFRTVVANTGDVQVSPSGTVTIQDLFGNPVETLSINSQAIDPGDVGVIATSWRSTFGVYTAKLALDYGGQAAVSESDLIFNIPWKPLLAAIMVAVSLRLLLGNRLSLPMPSRRRAAPAGARAGASASGGPAASASGGAAEPARPTEPRRPEQPRPRPVAARQAGLTAAQPEPIAEARPGAEPEPPLAPAPAPSARVEPLRAAEPPVRLRWTPPPTPRPMEPAHVATMASGNGNGVHHEADWQELFREGQQAARAGDRARAYGFFRRAVELNPRAEDAWLWRAGTTDNQEEAVACLEQVLAINPGNERARRGLESYRQRQGQV